MKLYKGTEMAERKGVGYTFFCAMVKAGLPKRAGRFAEADVDAWMIENPTFRSTDVYPKASVRPKPRQVRKAQSSCKSGAR